MKYRYSEQLKNLTAREMKDWFGLYQESARVNLFAGDPAESLLPTEELGQIAADYFQNPEKAGLLYETGFGYSALRVQLAAYARLVLHIGSGGDSILITEGVRQAFYAICQVFCNEGDGILCDQLTAPFVLMTAKQQGLSVMSVEMDNQGMVPERLEAILKTHPGVKLIYLSSEFQVPTGVTIPEERRKRLCEVAEQYGVMIVEDASVSQMRLYGEDLLPIKAFDTQSTVIYLGSFSQVLSPGLRVGYVIAGEDVIHRLAAYNQTHGAGAAPFSQMLCAEYLKKYSLTERIDALCEQYRSRYEQMTTQIEQKFPEDIYFSQPDGGLYLWCTDVSEQVNAARLASRLYEKHGIRIAAGDLFAAEEGIAQSSFCLNYTKYEAEELTEILDLIAAELREMMPGY